MAGRTRTIADLEVMLRANTASLQKSLDDVKKKLGDTGSSFKRAGKEATGSLEEAEDSVRLLADQVGVRLNRELERFIAKMPGVGEAISTAFNAIAIVAFAEVFIETGKKVYEFFEKSAEAAEKNRQAWETVERSQKLSNLQLDLAGTKLDNELAKLEHKPENKLAEGLQDAAVQAQELSNKLQESIEKYQTLLKQQAPGLLSSIVHGGTGYERTMLDQHKIHVAEATSNEELEAESKSWQKSLQVRLAQLQAWKAGKADSTGVLFSGNFQSEINTVQELIKLSAPEAHTIAQTEHNSGVQKKIDQLQGQKDAHDALEQADQKRLKALQTNLDRKEEILGKDASFELAYWDQVIGQLHKGTDAYREAGQKQHAAFMLMEADFHKAEEDANKRAVADGAFSTAGYQSYKDLAPTQADSLLAAAQQRAAEIAARNQARYQATLDRIGIRSGRLSPHQAALNAEQGDTQALQVEFIALTARLSRILAVDPEAAAKRQQIQNQIDQLTGTYRSQHLEDQYAVEMSTARGKVIDSLDQLTLAFTNTGEQISEIFTRTLSTVNDTIMQVLTTPGSMRRGQHIWGNTGAAIASGIGRTALEHAEGGVMHALGFGGGKAPKGTSSDRLHVTTKAEESSGASGAAHGLLGYLNNANWAGKLFGGRLFGSGGIFDHGGGSGSSGGGIFSSLLSGISGMFGGGHALGGDVLGGMPITVGELGPETFTPSTSGTITPHAQAFKAANHISIDARGATDPAAVHAAVHQAMAVYLPHVGSMAVAAQHDRNRRTPTSRRS